MPQTRNAGGGEIYAHNTYMHTSSWKSHLAPGSLAATRPSARLALSRAADVTELHALKAVAARHAFVHSARSKEEESQHGRSGGWVTA